MRTYNWYIGKEIGLRTADCISTNLTGTIEEEASREKGVALPPAHRRLWIGSWTEREGHFTGGHDIAVERRGAGR